MSCTPGVPVCDDTGTSADLVLILVPGAVGSVLLALVLLVVVALVRRPRSRRPPVTRVWLNADGDVVRRDGASLRP